MKPFPLLLLFLDEDVFKRMALESTPYNMVIVYQLVTKTLHSSPICRVLCGFIAWWRHQMETFSELLAFCAGHSLVTGEFPAQRPVTRSFDVFFGLLLNKRLSKQPRRRWFETPSPSLWRHCDGLIYILHLLLLCFVWYLLIADGFLLSFDCKCMWGGI